MTFRVHQSRSIQRSRTGLLPGGWWRAFLTGLAGAIAVLIVALAAAPALAETATNTGTVAAVVVAPNTLIKVDDMDFAKVGSRSTAGAVVLNPATGLCTTPNGVILSGPCQPAQFAGMGRRSFFVRINHPTTITLNGPGQAMTVDTITLDTAPNLTLSLPGNGNGNGNRRYLIVSLSGIFSFKMGGTLRINPNQAPGVYSGTYAVTAVYN